MISFEEFKNVDMRVAEILTSSNFHPRGIKVKLEDGQIGRAQKIW